MRLCCQIVTVCGLCCEGFGTDCVEIGYVLVTDWYWFVEGLGDDWVRIGVGTGRLGGVLVRDY